MIEYEELKKVNDSFFKEFEASFSRTLTSGWYILGNNVSSFESEFSNYNGCEYCIGVSSGLEALFLSLKAFQFKPGSEVIVPSNTYIATILSILHAGLIPVLVEPNINTYNIDPNLIEESITKKTVAIMVVHLYGKACEMDPIISLCKKYDLKLIEDCAQAHGATYKGKKVGTFGHFGAFSFYPTKNLGALGDGGAITTNDRDLAKIIYKIRNYGALKKNENEMIGYNSRLDEIQAGFLSIKLKKLDAINNHKNQLAQLYLDNLNNNFIKPIRQADFFDVYHIFNIRHKNRDALLAYLLKNGIKSEIHYPTPPHRQRALVKLFTKDYPISDEIHKTTLSLPISYSHDQNQIHEVIDILNSFNTNL